jgi:hypothetical protein
MEIVSMQDDKPVAVSWVEGRGAAGVELAETSVIWMPMSQQKLAMEADTLLINSAERLAPYSMAYLCSQLHA